MILWSNRYYLPVSHEIRFLARLYRSRSCCFIALIPLYVSYVSAIASCIDASAPLSLSGTVVTRGGVLNGERANGMPAGR
jgi:hypothetical protein